MKKCRCFELSKKTGMCTYYKGEGLESCRYNCDKLPKTGTKPVSKIPMGVDKKF